MLARCLMSHKSAVTVVNTFIAKPAVKEVGLKLVTHARLLSHAMVTVSPGLWLLILLLAATLFYQTELACKFHLEYGPRELALQLSHSTPSLPMCQLALFSCPIPSFLGRLDPRFPSLVSRWVSHRTRRHWCFLPTCKCLPTRLSTDNLWNIRLRLRSTWKLEEFLSRPSDFQRMWSLLPQSWWQSPQHLYPTRQRRFLFSFKHLDP
mmetsp:Transcript_95942/g.140191  ORF Transcript_95942/g.140191 Transcript_95942/m.140191 type:complete len:207 (+) Transcript_95942:2059-2679(+)